LPCLSAERGEQGAPFIKKGGSIPSSPFTPKRRKEEPTLFSPEMESRATGLPPSGRWLEGEEERREREGRGGNNYEHS